MKTDLIDKRTLDIDRTAMNATHETDVPISKNTYKHKSLRTYFVWELVILLSHRISLQDWSEYNSHSISDSSSGKGKGKGKGSDSSSGFQDTSDDEEDEDIDVELARPAKSDIIVTIRLFYYAPLV